MVIALLVVLVGHNISGLTSLLLGSGAFGLIIATFQRQLADLTNSVELCFDYKYLYIIQR